MLSNRYNWLVPVDPSPEVCARYHHAVELIGRRWSGAVLRTILDGNHRFAEIRATIPGLSDTMLAQRLRELEAEEIVERRVLATTPVRVEYHLTRRGRALDDALKAVADWAEEWLDVEDYPAVATG